MLQALKCGLLRTAKTNSFGQSAFLILGAYDSRNNDNISRKSHLLSALSCVRMYEQKRRINIQERFGYSSCTPTCERLCV